MAQADDFGEVYVGQPEVNFEEDFFFANNQPQALEAGEITGPETEEDIYTFSGDQASRNAQQDATRDGDEEPDDDDEDVQIVLDTDSVENRGSAPGSANKPPYGRGAPLIMPGRIYPIKRPPTLPQTGKQQKSVFELDIDALEDKPWRKPGVDITDYFNYGFNEDSWRAYSEKQAQMRLEQSMQSKIKVYESAKENTKSELPPELQAMVDGDKNKKRVPPRRGGEDWQNRGGFEHRRRTRDDDAVIQIDASMEMGDMPRSTPDRPDMSGMDEFYVPTMPGPYPPRGFADYPRDDRRREDDRKRERRSSRSPRRDERDKERDRDRDKRRDDRDRREGRREGSAERDRRRDREEKDRDKERDKDREEYKRKSTQQREDEERAKRRR